MDRLNRLDCLGMIIKPKLHNSESIVMQRVTISQVCRYCFVQFDDEDSLKEHSEKHEKDFGSPIPSDVLKMAEANAYDMEIDDAAEKLKHFDESPPRGYYKDLSVASSPLDLITTLVSPQNVISSLTPPTTPGSSAFSKVADEQSPPTIQYIPRPDTLKLSDTATLSETNNTDPEGIPLRIRKKLFNCGVCFKNYKYSKDTFKCIQRHGAIMCKICFQILLKGESLWIHNIRSGHVDHVKGVWNCNFCDEKFRCDFNLKMHIGSNHLTKVIKYRSTIHTHGTGFGCFESSTSVKNSNPTPIQNKVPESPFTDCPRKIIINPEHTETSNTVCSLETDFESHPTTSSEAYFFEANIICHVNNDPHSPKKRTEISDSIDASTVKKSSAPKITDPPTIKITPATPAELKPSCCFCGKITNSISDLIDHNENCTEKDDSHRLESYYTYDPEPDPTALCQICNKDFKKVKFYELIRHVAECFKKNNIKSQPQTQLDGSSEESNTEQYYKSTSFKNELFKIFVNY